MLKYKKNFKIIYANCVLSIELIKSVENFLGLFKLVTTNEGNILSHSVVTVGYLSLNSFRI